MKQVDATRCSTYPACAMFSSIVNTILLPVRLVFRHETVNKLGLRSMRDERNNMVKKHAKGRLLDIGCGSNQLVRSYGHESVGIDVYDFGGGALLVKDSANLPFDDASFDTVSFVASLNHIPQREATLREAHRLLRPGGRVLITMLSPLVGIIRHHLAWWDEDQHERGMKEGEAMGLSPSFIIEIMEKQGFKLQRRKRFVLGLNNLYIFERRNSSE